MTDDSVNRGIVKAGAFTTAFGAVSSVPYVMGFSASGVVKGTIAAGIQSGIGNVAASSAFAAIQSLAATTVVGTALPLVVTAAGVTAVGYGAHKLYQSNQNK